MPFSRGGILVWLIVLVVAVTAMANPPFSVGELENAIQSRISRVDEFQFLREQAEKMGVRAWLFGGTAASYAHFVKWDLEREKGATRFQPERLSDYQYFNIFRSTQDLDVVIDGTPEQAAALENILREKFPHSQGSKSSWELRLLTKPRGEKDAILKNPDFLNQHTDSNSTGLIEVTKPKNGELVVRDARDWESREPYFLRDVHEGKLHYYFSDSHSGTKRFKEGKNPPIFSVIRYLTKAFQYELKLRPEDLDQVRTIIREFNPEAFKIGYSRDWIEKNARKLFHHAINLEYAAKVLEEIGLREKLVSMGKITDADSMSWWLNRSPLKSSKVGEGTGKTAKDLGITTVAHETKDYLAYESITRAHTGDPNVFISRDRVQGEAAVYGDGFYTQIGRTGARGTGITIRFHLDPNAREGTDFKRRGDYVIIQNKSAIRVIPESLDFTPEGFFEFLIHGHEVDHNDRGLLFKMKQQIRRKLNFDALAQSRVRQLVADHFRSEKIRPSVLSEWFSLDPGAHELSVLDEVGIKNIIDNLDKSEALEATLWEAVTKNEALQRSMGSKLLKKYRTLLDANVATAFTNGLVIALKSNPPDVEYIELWNEKFGLALPFETRQLILGSKSLGALRDLAKQSTLPGVHQFLDVALARMVTTHEESVAWSHFHDLIFLKSDLHPEAIKVLAEWVATPGRVLKDNRIYPFFWSIAKADPELRHVKTILEGIRDSKTELAPYAKYVTMPIAEFFTRVAAEPYFFIFMPDSHYSPLVVDVLKKKYERSVEVKKVVRQLVLDSLKKEGWNLRSVQLWHRIDPAWFTDKEVLNAVKEKGVRFLDDIESLGGPKLLIQHALRLSEKDPTGSIENSIKLYVRLKNSFPGEDTYDYLSALKKVLMDDRMWSREKLSAGMETLREIVSHSYYPEISEVVELAAKRALNILENGEIDLGRPYIHQPWNEAVYLLSRLELNNVNRKELERIAVSAKEPLRRTYALAALMNSTQNHPELSRLYFEHVARYPDQHHLLVSHAVGGKVHPNLRAFVEDFAEKTQIPFQTAANPEFVPISYRSHALDLAIAKRMRSGDITLTYEGLNYFIQAANRGTFAHNEKFSPETVRFILETLLQVAKGEHRGKATDLESSRIQLSALTLMAGLERHGIFSEDPRRLERFWQQGIDENFVRRSQEMWTRHLSGLEKEKRSCPITFELLARVGQRQ